MREVSEVIPKPMIPVGKYPILLHVMNYYAHYGHKEFLLCLGYKADNIRTFFENSSRGLPSEYVSADDYGTLEYLQQTMSDWDITFANTGLDAKVGQRLYAVRDRLQGDEFFLANYADVLTDAPLPEMIGLMRQRDMVGSFLCAQPTYSFHVVTWKDDHMVADIAPCTQAEIWMNGGYFVFRPELFNYMEPEDELVEAPFKRLISQNQLLGYRHNGFWAPMDTLKDRQTLCEMYERGDHPWVVWEETSLAPLSVSPKHLVHNRHESALSIAKIA